MGEVQVPADALWGAQTARAVENFPISGQPVPAGVVHALALLKGAAAEVNAELGVLDRERADAIVAAAAARWRAGRHDDQFPIDVFQTGSGTSTNMNVNEVVGPDRPPRDRAERPPQRPRQRGQSSNDTFPSALRHGGAPWRCASELAPALVHLAEALARQGDRVRRRGQGRAHPPHGRRAGHPRPGVRRLRPAGRAGPAAGAAWPPRPRPSCRWAAPPPAPASTPRRASPRPVIAGVSERDRRRVPRGGEPLRGPVGPGRASSSSAGPSRSSRSA